MYKRIYKATILAKFLSKVQYSIIKNERTITFFPKCDILKRVRKMHKSERKRTFFSYLMRQKQIKSRFVSFEISNFLILNKCFLMIIS